MSYNSLYGRGTHSEDANLSFAPLLQETTGTTAQDSSSNNRDGTIVGMGSNPTTATGPNWLSSAFSFDGSNDYVNFGNLNLFTGAFTVTCWIKTSTTAQGHIVAKRDDLGGSDVFPLMLFRIQATNGKLFGGVASGGSATRYRESSSTINNNAWRHVAIVWDGSGSPDLYIDGSLNNGTATTAGTVSLSPWNDNVTIGSLLSSASIVGPLNGALAGPSIWSRAFSGSEIGEDRLGPEPLYTSGGTLTISTTAFSGTAPTYDSQGNTGLSIAWELRDADDNSMVDNGTTTSGGAYSGSGSFSGDYYTWFRASNDGGYDAAEDYETADETASGGGVTATPTTAALILNTFAPTVSTPILTTPETLALLLSTYSPTITVGDSIEVVPSTTNLILTTFTPVVATPTIVTPPEIDLALTGYSPDVLLPVLCTPSTTALVITSFTPTITLGGNQAVTPTTATLTLTSFSPVVTAGDAVEVIPDTKALVLTTFAPTVSTPITITPNLVTLNLTSYSATIQTPLVITPITRTLTLTTYAPNFGEEQVSNFHYYYLMMQGV